MSSGSTPSHATSAQSAGIDFHKPEVGNKIEFYCRMENAKYLAIVAEEQGDHENVVHDDRGTEPLHFDNKI